MSYNVETYSDEHLAKLVQGGDTEIFGALIERYEQKMIRYAKKFLFDDTNATDLVQDVFIKAYEHIDSFDSAKKFSPWLYRIAHNCFINEIKRKLHEPLLVFDMDVFFPGVPTGSPEEKAIEKELQVALDACINDMEQKYREVLILFYYEELSYAEISEVLRIPVATVGMRISRAKKALRKSILTRKDL